MKTTPPERGERVSYPRFRRVGSPPHVEITRDDAAILKEVYRHRFVRADDLYRLFAERSPDRLSRRLTLLFRGEYLDRPLAQIDQYRKGGSHALVYGLGNAGARYLKEVAGMSIGATDWRSRNRTYTRENLDHTLAVAHYLIALDLACRVRSDLSLITFEEILAASPEATRRSKSPMSWPVPIQWHGGKAVVQLAPDGIFGLRKLKPDGISARAFFFLEMDRGTMTIVPSERVQRSDAFPYRATILRKFYAYADSYRLKLHEERFGIKAPRTLFITTSDARAEAMSATFDKLVRRPMRLPEGLILFSGAKGAGKALDVHCG